MLLPHHSTEDYPFLSGRAARLMRKTIREDTSFAGMTLSAEEIDTALRADTALDLITAKMSHRISVLLMSLKTKEEATDATMIQSAMEREPAHGPDGAKVIPNAPPR